MNQYSETGNTAIQTVAITEDTLFLSVEIANSLSLQRVRFLPYTKPRRDDTLSEPYMNARDMLSYLQREHDEIVRALDDPNLLLVGDHTDGAAIDIQRLRKESEYAFTMAEMKTLVANLYVKLVEV